MKTSELIGPALDWAVAKALFGNRLVHYRTWLENEYWKDKDFSFAPANEYRILSEDFDGLTTGFIEHYSTDWSQGGPIIEKEKIAIDWDYDCWNASTANWPAYYSASTPLIAAMRCYVASKLGYTVEIPEELS